MSLMATLVAVRNHLRDQLKYNSEDCMITHGGRPPATMGARFISIYGQNWSPDFDPEQALAESYALAVTVTQRVNAVPWDANGQEAFVSDGFALERLIRSTILAIHKNYTLLDHINALIGGDYKLIEPLVWTGGDPQPELIDSSWFLTSSDVINQQDNVALTWTVTFGKARRIQPLASAT